MRALASRLALPRTGDSRVSKLRSMPARGSGSTRSLGLGDFLYAVAVGPEDFVGFRVWRSAEERVDVFPDDFPVFCDLEEAAERRFIDQRVAVWQSLSVAHSRREKIRDRPILIRPHDLVCRWIDLDDPRKRQRVIQAMNSVIEDQDVAVLQKGWRMLAGQRRRPQLPDHFACVASDA